MGMQIGVNEVPWKTFTYKFTATQANTVFTVGSTLANDSCGPVVDGLTLVQDDFTGFTTSTAPDTVSSAIAGSWTRLGCYSNNPAPISSTAYNFAGISSVETCLRTCLNNGMAYAALENGKLCYCSNTLADTIFPAPSSECNVACLGDSSSTCGGLNRVYIYRRSNVAVTGTFISSLTVENTLPIASWRNLGCYTDNGSPRRGLTGLTIGSDNFINIPNLTPETCQLFCASKGYSLAGVQASTQCFCGNTIASSSLPTLSSYCTSTCGGKSSSQCGGIWRMTIFASPNASSQPSGIDTLSTTQAGSWPLLGCYTDNGVPRRALTGLTIGSDNFSAQNALTLESCQAYCGSQGFALAGLEATSQCFCGNSIADSSIPVDLSTCNTQCNGNNSQSCGGIWRISIYRNPKVTTIISSGISTLKSQEGDIWRPLGCFIDNSVPRRALTGLSINGENFLHQNMMTVKACQTYCRSKNFALAGVENGDQCLCGDAIANTSLPLPIAQCSSPCNGNNTETCGGSWRIQVFQNLALDMTPFKTSTQILQETKAGSWPLVGCFSDNSFPKRALKGLTFGSDNFLSQNALTIESCQAYCAIRGFALAGVQATNECYCGNSIASTSASLTVSSCSSTCNGNSTQMCGGIWKISIYRNPEIIENSLALWKPLGCYGDNGVPRRALNGLLINGDNFLSQNTLTVRSCLSYCNTNNFAYAGVENGNQCFCGNSIANTSLPLPAAHCSTKCNGNATETCGGGWRIEIFQKLDSEIVNTTSAQTLIDTKAGSGHWPVTATIAFLVAPCLD